MWYPSVVPECRTLMRDPCVGPDCGTKVREPSMGPDWDPNETNLDTVVLTLHSDIKADLKTVAGILPASKSSWRRNDRAWTASNWVIARQSVRPGSTLLNTSRNSRHSFHLRFICKRIEKVVDLQHYLLKKVILYYGKYWFMNGPSVQRSCTLKRN